VEGITIKRFDDPDKTVEFVKGRLQVVELGGLVLGRAEYEPGWLWSRDVAGDPTGNTLCPASHVGMVVQGANRVTMKDGTTVVMRAGDFFAIGPGHESEVVGDDHYVSVHLTGVEDYLKAI
jgi:hypothetical protein